jgi:hypothetical protein
MVEVSISGCQAFVSAFKGCLTLMQFQDAGIYYLCFTGEKKKKRAEATIGKQIYFLCLILSRRGPLIKKVDSPFVPSAFLEPA